MKLSYMPRKDTFAQKSCPGTRLVKNKKQVLCDTAGFIQAWWGAQLWDLKFSRSHPHFLLFCYILLQMPASAAVE